MTCQFCGTKNWRNGDTHCYWCKKQLQNGGRDGGKGGKAGKAGKGQKTGVDRLAQIAQEFSKAVKQVPAEERKTHQPLVDAIEQATMEEKLVKRRSKKLDVQYDECSSAVERAQKRVDKLKEDRAALAANLEKEETTLQQFKTDLAELAKQCKEQWDLVQLETEDMDATEPREATGSPERFAYGGSDAHWEAPVSGDASWGSWRSSYSAQDGKVEKLEAALEQQQLHSQQQFVEIKEMFAVLAQQQLLVMDPQRAGLLAAQLVQPQQQQQVMQPLTQQSPQAQQTTPQQPNTEDIAHMHLATAVHVAAVVTEASSPPATGGVLALAATPRRRHSSPRSPVPSGRSRRATSACPRQRDVASHDPY